MYLQQQVYWSWSGSLNQWIISDSLLCRWISKSFVIKSNFNFCIYLNVSVPPPPSNPPWSVWVVYAVMCVWNLSRLLESMNHFRWAWDSLLSFFSRTFRLYLFIHLFIQMYCLLISLNMCKLCKQHSMCQIWFPLLESMNHFCL